MARRSTSLSTGGSTPILERLVASGRATLARRPGYRPRMHPADGTDKLSGTLAAMRDEEGW